MGRPKGASNPLAYTQTVSIALPMHAPFRATRRAVMPPLPPVTKAFLLACVGFFCLFELLPGLAPWFELWPLNSGVFMPWQLLTLSLIHI